MISRSRTPPLRRAALFLAGLIVVSATGLSDASEGRTPGSPAPGTETHWAFQPLRRPQPPVVQNEAWVRNDLDRFILAQLEARGLAPVSAASPAVMLRRITLDLTGLPPTPEETEAFLQDRAPRAFERVSERLLASPHYGERWGRYWMDVARYADTAGDNADYPVPELYRYRDYIIRAFNADKPFDRFVQEQLAGDILAGRGESEYADGIVATGFLALSRRYGTGPYELWHLTLENTIETVGQAFLGLNLKCARCHDHKFDPVTMRDYYGLYGIFASTQFPWAGSEEVQSKNFNRLKFVPLVPEAEAAPRVAAWQTELERLRAQIAAVEQEPTNGPAGGTARTQRLESLKRTLRTLEKPGAPADLPVAYGVREGTPADVPLQRRGEPDMPADVTPRCVPSFLAGAGAPSFTTNTSGRLELAHWLTRPDHPLTARVMVNRIWQHHFGEGLVNTPNNFGLRSETPVHRDLLDYLACRFVESGWSVKAMHRLILASATYRLSSEGSPALVAADPANRLHGRFLRQRLDAEALRDAFLSVSGELDPNPPGAHPFPPPERWTWTQHTPFKDRYDTQHRSVYLMTQRFQRHPFLALFDGPDTNNSTESRRRSVVPQQALFAMNDPWLDARASGLAGRVLREVPDDRGRIQRLLMLTWSRPPSVAEVDRWAGWLERSKAGAAAEPEAWTVLARVALTSNEFFHVD